MKRTLLLAFTCFCMLQANAQPPKKVKELKYNLGDDGDKYIKVTFLNQTWLRWNQSNPGTTVNGQPKDQTLDIGLRRTRMQMFGQITDHVFFYTQFGLNNFNHMSTNGGNRKFHAFFHDALGEFKVFKKNDALKIGGGLTIANGVSRFSQPSVSTIMTADVPVFLQTTVDQTDEFARKMSVYARGQIGKFDYRIIFSNPFPIQTNGQTPPPINTDATFTTYGHSHQYHGMLIYNILEREPHTTPYMAGTYLGDKKVLNVEVGALYQPDAMWRLSGADTVFDNLLFWSAAVFADMPIMQNKYAISAYISYTSTDYGLNYVRNNGLMNPANGNSDPMAFNGAGNSYPMFGTGSNVYAQAGLRLPNDLFGQMGTLMPYVSYRWASFDKLTDPVNIFDAGVNWLINKHNAKLSLNYQLRPVFTRQASGIVSNTSYAHGAFLQYQVFL